MLMRQQIQVKNSRTDMQKETAGECIICNNKTNQRGRPLVRQDKQKIVTAHTKLIFIGEKKLTQRLMKTSLERFNRLRHHHPFRKGVPNRYHSHREEALAELQSTPLMRELELVPSSLGQG